jgi:hypothetical protein
VGKGAQCLTIRRYARSNDYSATLVARSESNLAESAQGGGPGALIPDVGFVHLGVYYTVPIPGLQELKVGRYVRLQNLMHRLFGFA